MFFMNKESPVFSFPKNMNHAVNSVLGAAYTSLVYLFPVCYMINSGTVIGLTLASGGWNFNLIVFLLNEFNMKSIQAAQMNNIINGFYSTSPIFGAILADSFFDDFMVALIASIISLLGLCMFIMMVAISSLRPPPCINNATGSSLTCSSSQPSTAQMAFLYIAIALGIIGVGGTRSVLNSLAAYQLNKTKDQRILINWLVFAGYVGYTIGYLVLVYIETSVSWSLGFGISIGANVIAIILFVSGKPFFRKAMTRGNPFTSITRVLIATVRKLKEAPARLPEGNGDDCFHYDDHRFKTEYGPPTASLRCLNRAAMIMDDSRNAATTSNKSWKTCSVEEVEDLKKLIKIVPIWVFGIFYNTPISSNVSLVVIQALVMDRHLGKNFKIPPATFIVFTLFTSAIVIAVLDRFFYPLWKRLFGREMTPLKRMGCGHVCNIIAMIVAALIEKKRLDLVNDGDHPYSVNKQQGAVAPMSALWLALPLTIIGIGEAFETPGEAALNYQEFPKNLRNTAFGAGALRIAVGFYLSAALNSVVQRTTSWLPNDVNKGRIDYVYWLLSIIGFVNFICFVIYATIYKYNNPSPEDQA